MADAIWRVIGASVQGTSHQEKAVPCQDAHQYRILPDGELLIAVADGAGSAARAEAGAAAAVAQAIATLEIALAPPPQDEAGWVKVMRAAFQAAQTALSQLAASDNTPLRAFATTLTCALVAGDWLVVGQLGDGVAVAAGATGDLFLAVQPQRSEYANETYFLTMVDALDYVVVCAEPCFVHALAVTTDGLLRLALKLPGYEPHAPFFAPLFAFTAEMDDPVQAREQLAAFLASPRVCSRADDDKTLVLAVRNVPATDVTGTSEVPVT